MSTVTVIANNYPEYTFVRPVGYSLMGVLGYQMLNNGVHWASDYPLAIALGYGFGKIAVRKGRKSSDQASIRLYPILLPGGGGVSAIRNSAAFRPKRKHDQEIYPRVSRADDSDGNVRATAVHRFGKAEALPCSRSPASPAARSSWPPCSTGKFKSTTGPTAKPKPARDLRKAGDIGQLAGPIVGTVFLLEGAAGHNAKSHETGVLLYESFLISGAATGVLKFAIGRKRPSATTEPFSFKPAGSNASFPSGHTTTAFAAAEVLAEQYPRWWVTVPAYGAASAVGFSRLRANQHWLSDVVAGAAVGISTEPSSSLVPALRRENRRLRADLRRRGTLLGEAVLAA